MNNDWLSSISTLLNRRSSNQDDIEQFIQKISQPALVVANKSGNIIFANHEAGNFFKRPPEDLKSIDFRGLIEEYHLTTGKTDKPASKSTLKKSKGGYESRDQKAFFSLLPLRQQRTLILIEILREPSRDLSVTDGYIFDSLALLSESLLNSSASTYFANVLHWVGKLATADYVTLYLADETRPAFSIQESYGKNPGLPEELPASDLAAISLPHIWEPEHRTSPVSALTRSLGGKKITCLVSLPVGEPGATIGVLVIIFATRLAPDRIKEIGSIAVGLIKNKIAIQSQSTELQEKTLNLLEKIHTYEIIDEFIQEGILVVSSDLNVLRLNPSIVEILGYSKEEVLGQHIDNVLIGYDSLHPPIDQVKMKNSIQKVTNQLLFRRNGEQFLANITLLPVNVKDRIESIVMIIEDLSEKERIRLQTEQLEQRAYTGEVTAIFAHEVLNPVNNISTGLQLLSRSLAPTDPIQVEITRLLQDSDRLVDLMRSVLITSKPNEYSMKPLDISIILQRLVDRRMMRMQNAKIRAELQIHPDTPLILGDLYAIEQVFNNILNNAIQAMGETGGELVIKTQPAESQQDGLDHDGQKRVEISIADTGPGIPPEIQERIFQPFYTTRPSGSGLGLTIVKRIITLHKGTIRLESFPGGTIFYISLPALKSDDEEIF